VMLAAGPLLCWALPEEGRGCGGVFLWVCWKGGVDRDVGGE